MFPGKLANREKVEGVRHSFRICLLLLLFAFALPCFPWPSAMAAEEVDSRLVSGLVQRRMYDLAQLHLEQRLSSKKVSPREVVDLNVLLLKVKIEKAQSLSAEAQKAAFEEAYLTGQACLKIHAQNPRLGLVRFQMDQIGLAMGEFARLAAQLGEPIDEAYRSRLRESISAMEKMDRDLAQAVPRQFQKEGSQAGNSRRAPSDDLSADELLSLQTQLRQQLTKAYACQAGLYPKGSPDWRSGLMRGSELVDGALSQLPTRDSRRVRLVVLRESLLRELGETPLPLEEVISSLGTDPDSLPPELRSLWSSELVRRLVAAQDLAQGAAFVAHEESLFQEAATSATSIAIEWDFARLELAIAQWKKADTLGAAASTAARQRVNQLLASIEQDRGTYWSKRARQLLAKDLPAGAAADDTTALLALAEGAVRNQDWPSARRFFQDASRRAEASGDMEQAVDLAFRSAQLFQKEKDFTRGAEAFLQIADRFPKQKQAADAHLAAIWHWGQLAAKDDDAAQHYVKLLKEHPQRFPTAGTLSQAYAWQGRLAETNRDWRTAVIAYQGIDRASPLFEAIVPRLLSSAKSWLQSSQADPEQERRIARSLADYLEGVLVPPEVDNSTEPAAIAWTTAQRQIAVALAELWVLYFPEKLGEVEPMLRSALSAGGEIDPLWQAQAQAQLIRGFLAQPGKEAAAQRELDALLKSAPEQLPPLIELLAATMGEVAGQRQALLGSLLLSQLDTLEKQAGVSKPSDVPPKWKQYRAQALIATGKRPAAKQLLTTLAKELPRDANVQVLLARCLSGGSPEDQALALGQWRIVASRAKSHSNLWYEAKYEVARLQVQQGKKAEAAQLIAYLLETPPGISDAGWKQRFTTLLGVAQRK